MMTERSTFSAGNDCQEPGLPPGLTRAMESVRQRAPGPGQLERVIARASQLSLQPVTAVRTPLRSTRLPSAVPVVSCAVAVLLLTALLAVPRQPAPAVPTVVRLRIPDGDRVYSAVTRTGVAEACRAQIEADLQQAEQQIAAASDAVELSEFQQDIQAALEKYRMW